jgi:fatty acid desaturase
MFTQVVFLGHDAGHQQIFGSRRGNRIVGLFVANALTGLSYGWWVPKHNAHHTYPNQLGRDPDIGPGAIAFTFTAEMAERHHGASRLLARWQAWLFFPLLLLEGAGLHLSSVDSLVRRRDRSAALEGVLLLGNAALYLTLVLSVLTPLRAFVFVVVQQSLFGLYLGCSFAPNHKGMPILDRDDDMCFTRRQVITARNVRGGRFTAFMLGGLNYQIEHHLFPTMPRANLARSQRIIREFCAAHDLPYCEESLVGSYRRALRHLHTVGAGLRPQPLSTVSASSMAAHPSMTYRPRVVGSRPALVVTAALPEPTLRSLPTAATGQQRVRQRGTGSPPPPRPLRGGGGPFLAHQQDRPMS